MKFLLLVFLFGLAAANFHDELFQAHNEALESFKEEFDGAFPYAYEFDEDDTVDKLKDHIDRIAQKMKDAVEKGQTIKEDLIVQYKELKKKLKEMGGKLSDKAKELQERIVEKFKEVWNKLLDKLSQKRSLLNEYSDAVESFKAEYGDEYEMDEDDTVDKIKDHIDRLTEKMKEAVDKGQTIKEDLIVKYKELKKKLKEMGGKLSEKAKELQEKIADKFREVWNKLLEKLKEKRSLNEVQHGFKDLLQQLKDLLNKHFNFEELKEKIKEKFGDFKEAKEVLIQELKEHGKKALKEFIEHLLQNKEKKSIKELWEKMKEYWNKLKLEWNDKYAQFIEFVKEKFGKALEHYKDKKEKVTAIAKKMIEDHKNISKEVALEALEFMRPYKDDLGKLWDDLKKSLKDVLQGNE